MKNQMALIGSPEDFCTTAHAAEVIGVSQRYVRELIKFGKLEGATPRVGSKETARRHLLLYVAQVQAFADARQLLSKTLTPTS